MKPQYRCIAVCVLLVLAFLPFATAETVMLPMRDGTKLHTDVYLPEGDGPFPVMLYRTCYGMNAGAPVAERFHKLGMAFVLQNTRGRGQSEGKDMAFGDDGWGANVNVKIVDSKEAAKVRKKTKGFCGYDWMIDSIIERQEIKASHELDE